MRKEPPLSAHPDQEANEDQQAQLAQRVGKVERVIEALEALKGHPDLKEYEVALVYQGLEVFAVCKARLDSKALRDHKGRPDQEASQDR